MATRRPLRLLFHPFLFLSESWNGIDEHLLLLSTRLDRERFEPLVLVHESDGTQTRTLAERAGIEILSAPYGPGAGARERLRELRSLYEREQISLLHVHSPVAGGQAVPAVAARLAGVTATLATYHQIQPLRLSRKSRLANRVTHRRLVDSVMAVSHGVELSLRTNAGVGGPMKVVHNGIDDAGADVAPGDLPARERATCGWGTSGGSRRRRASPGSSRWCRCWRPPTRGCGC